MLLFCQSKPIALLAFSLTSPWSLLKLPNDNFAGGVTPIWKVLIDYHFNSFPFSLREYIYIIICSDQSDQKCSFPDSLTFVPKCLNFCTQIKVSWLFPALEEFNFSLNISWSMTTDFHQISKRLPCIYLFLLFVSCLLCFWNWSVFAVSFCHDLFCCCCFFHCILSCKMVHMH